MLFLKTCMASYIQIKCQFEPFSHSPVVWRILRHKLPPFLHPSTLASDPYPLQFHTNVEDIPDISLLVFLLVIYCKSI